MIRKYILFLLFVMILLPITISHEEAEIQKVNRWSDPVFYIEFAGVFVLIVALFVTTIGRKFAAKYKIFFFIIIALPIVFASLFLSADTIYDNIVSETGGPVHWHADYQVWNCGEQIQVMSPEGILNRVGTTLLHEHNDNRIHVEGTIFDKKEIVLSHFFEDIGGALTDSYMTVPTDNGVVNVNNGALCNGKPAKVQVFVYKITNAYKSQKHGFEYKQEKITDYQNYILSPYSNVPPGDCIIIEFDQEKEKTDKLCESYEVAIEKGNMKEVENG